MVTAEPPVIVPVPDLPTALRYYEQVLGCTIVRHHTGEAVVALGGTRLRLSADAPRSPAGSTTVVRVDRPDGVFDVLDRRGARIGPCLDHAHGDIGSFAVTDGCGNVLCVAPTRTPLAALRRLLTPRLPDVVRDRRQRRRVAKEEQPHLEAFRAFHRALPPTDAPVWYLFFSAGLLHWVVRALDFAGPDVEVVLLGSALPADEQQWIRNELGRPFHHVDLRIDDKTAWDFLIDTHHGPFGWLDVDCLVLERGLFTEMADLPEGAYANSVWAFDGGPGVRLGCTHFLYVDGDVLRHVRDTEGVSANLYSWRPFDRRVPGRECPTTLIRHRLARRLLEVLPRGEGGRPADPGGIGFFDTTIVLQVLAHAAGRHLGEVRSLRVRDEAVGVQEQSDEIVHIGGVSYAGALSEFSETFHSPESRLRYLVADQITLDATAGRLPQSYAERGRRVREALGRLGVTPEQVPLVARQYLTSALGVSGPTADRLLATVPSVKQTAPPHAADEGR